MALELEVERRRVVEALNARDVTVTRLSDAYLLLRQKTAQVERLQIAIQSGTTSELSSTDVKPKLADQKKDVAVMENTIRMLQDEIRNLREERVQVPQPIARPPPGSRSPGPPPRYDEGMNMPEIVEYLQTNQAGLPRPPAPSPILRPGNPSPHQRPGLPHIIMEQQARLGPSRPPSPGLSTAPPSCMASPRVSQNSSPQLSDQAEDPIYLEKARFAALEVLPLPPSVPQDTVQPIIMPPSMSLHELLGAIPVPYRSHLARYRILNSATAQWCPEREEHGFFYSPMFKCTTSTRVSTAHCWSNVDPVGRFRRPTECFYNKDGTWYYAGVYVGFKIDEVSTREWVGLPATTVDGIVRDTLSGRKNISPSNTFEIRELYGAGALKAACVGLQCVGFNYAVYKAVLDQAKRSMDHHWKLVMTGQRDGTSAPMNDLTNSFAQHGLGSQQNNGHATSEHAPALSPHAGGR
ncbi:hypothetical protein BDN72DRAFT_845674 [Pluteus cervinus]|uniref:Uncharacterized protein n=1 Tax=Pluteus cervinus TaxID=181527 RepID=A0ACD3AIS6_9AGAR|nr:hypothetical protein BDN72DRAFT_845674 [Pluteus cervinus]